MNTVELIWQKDANTLLNKYVFKTEGEQCPWGRLLCTWHEKGEGPKEKRIHHVCFSINLASVHGDVYIDDSKTVIFFKSLGVLAVRVAQVFAKTLFHLALPLSFPIITIDTVFKEVKYNEQKEAAGQLGDKHTMTQICKKCLDNCAESVLDIIRTPCYGLLMTVSSVFAVFSAPFSPSSLYDYRKQAGDFEDKMAEHDTLGFWKWTPCFHPFTTIDSLFKEKRSLYPDTDYGTCKNQFEVNLSNIARSRVRRMRRADQERGSLCDSTQPYNSDSFNEIALA